MANKKQSKNRQNELQAQKKAEVLGGTKNLSRGKGAIWGLVVVAIVIGVGVWLLNQAGIIGGEAQVAQAVASSSNVSEVRLDAAQFADGKARHFTYKSPNGIEIRYFVLKSSDGVIRAAFDACDVCWRSNKGYSQDGDVMVCNNCGRRFASVKVNEVKGGCNPAPLARQVVDGKVLIKVADILAGQQFFNFRS